MSSMLADDATVRANDKVVACDLENEVVLLDPAGVYYGLNRVGARIWHLLQQPTTVAAIYADLLESFAAEPSQCRRDMEAFLGQMIDAGLADISVSPRP